MYVGDFLEDQTVDLFFNTAVNGVPTTLAGSPAVSIYKDNGTTEFTTGVTLTVDFDGRTGLHQLRVVTTSLTYSPGSLYTAVITTGTVGGISVAGDQVGSFTIENQKVILANVSNQGGTGMDLNIRKITFTTPTGNAITANVTSGYFLEETAGQGVRVQNAQVAGDVQVGSNVEVTGTTTLTGAFTATNAGNDVRGVDVKKINASATAAARAAQFWGTVEQLTVDTTGFAGSTTTFQISSTTDEEDAYLDQALYFVTGPNAGETVFITAYTFSTNVRLTVSNMKATPTNGDIILKMGRT